MSNLKQYFRRINKIMLVLEINKNLKKDPKPIIKD
jgi:hypothetical protein